MNAALRLAYAAAAHLARAAAAVTSGGDTKWRRSLHARRGIRNRYGAWRGRDLARPLLWMHAPSVGEGLQARVVLELVRARRPDIQLAYTFFSPSAEGFAGALDVDFVDYLPFDTAGDARVALQTLRPTALVFSKVDVWPILVDEAAARRVPLGLISGAMSQVSSRRGALAVGLLADSYAKLSRVGAVSEADAERLIRLGVPSESVRVTGDTRYDQAWNRAARADRTGALLAPLVSPRPTLVAGSTWPSDEEVLLEAWVAVRRELRDARLIIAPHEPTAEHLAPIESWIAGAHLRGARLGTPEASTADVVVVDRVGVLGDLYALADTAFVGGGFHSAGLHSVLEPAAFGAPVIFGPRYAGSRDALLLAQSGGGESVTTVDETIEDLLTWLADASARQTAGAEARALVERGRGAAERSYGLVMELVEQGLREPALR